MRCSRDVHGNTMQDQCMGIGPRRHLQTMESRDTSGLKSMQQISASCHTPIRDELHLQTCESFSDRWKGPPFPWLV